MSGLFRLRFSQGIGLGFAGEFAGPDVDSKLAEGGVDLAAGVGVTAHEFRRPVEQAQHVLCDQYLTIAAGGRADADCGGGDLFGDGDCDGLDHALDHDREGTGLVEKPPVAEAPSNKIVSGRYILQPEVMRLLEDQEKGAGGEIQLTDAMARMIGNQPFHAVTFAGRRFDCGSKTGFVEATLALAMEREDMGAEVRAMAERLLSE